MEQHGYRRLREIGKGAFGQAVLCQDSEGKRFVAKQLDLTTMSRAERESCVNEVRVLRKLNHPNIVRYVDHFATQQALYIIMEYADSGDLGSMLSARRATFSEEEALHYLVQICLALKHLHDANILHRDLKAQNIFLAHKGRMVKLGDFGISTVLKSAGALAKTQCGTPFYFSPEMCQGLPYNAKSDMWSLGVLLYEMCTLRKPFQASNYKGLMTAICAGNPRPISETYSPELRGLLSVLMHKDPAARPSASDLLRMDFVRRKMEQIVGDSIRVPHTATPPTAPNAPSVRPVRMPSAQQPNGAVLPKPNNYRMPGIAHHQQQQQRRVEVPAVPAKPTTAAAAPKQPPQPMKEEVKPPTRSTTPIGTNRVQPEPRSTTPWAPPAPPAPFAPVQEYVTPVVAPLPSVGLQKADIKVNLHVSPYPRPPCMRLPSDTRPTPTLDSCLPPSLLQGAAARPNLPPPPAPVPTAITEAVRRRMANVEGPGSIPQSFTPITPTTTSHQPNRWTPLPPPSVAAVPPGAPTTPTIPPSRLPSAPFSMPTMVPRHAPVVVPPTTIVVTAPPRAALPVERAVKAFVTAESVVNSLPTAMTGDSPKKQFLEPVVPKPEGGLQGVPLILLSPMTANRVLRDAEQFTEAALDRLEALGRSETETPKGEQKETPTTPIEVAEEKSPIEKVDEEQMIAGHAFEEVDDEEVTDAVRSMTSESSAPSTRSSSVEPADEEPVTPTEAIEAPPSKANEVVESAEDAPAEPLVTVATEEVEYSNMLEEIASLLGVEGEGDVSTTWLPAESCTNCNMHRGECEEHAHEEVQEERGYVDAAEAALDRLEALGKSESDLVEVEVVEVVETQVSEIASVEGVRNETLPDDGFDFLTVSQLALATAATTTAPPAAEADFVNQIADALVNAENNAAAAADAEEGKSVLDEEVDALAASLSPSQTSQRSPSASNGGESPAFSEADSSLNVSMYSDAGVVEQRRNPAGMLMWAAAAMAAPMALWYQVATLTA